MQQGWWKIWNTSPIWNSWWRGDCWAWRRGSSGSNFCQLRVKFCSPGTSHRTRGDNLKLCPGRFRKKLFTGGIWMGARLTSFSFSFYKHEIGLIIVWPFLSLIFKARKYKLNHNTNNSLNQWSPELFIITLVSESFLNLCPQYKCIYLYILHVLHTTEFIVFSS